MEVINNEAAITKSFPSKKAALDFLHSLETSKGMIEQVGNLWNLTYITTRSIVTLPEQDWKRVEL